MAHCHPLAVRSSQPYSRKKHGRQTQPRSATETPRRIDRRRQRLRRNCRRPIRGNRQIRCRQRQTHLRLQAMIDGYRVAQPILWTFSLYKQRESDSPGGRKHDYDHIDILLSISFGCAHLPLQIPTPPAEKLTRTAENKDTQISLS